MKVMEIRLRRIERGVRQDDLAKAAGLHPCTLVDIERGRLGVDEETYRCLTDTLERLGRTKQEVSAVCA